MNATQDRRISDMLDGMTDHDLLIAHTVKINQLCGLVTSFDKKMDIHVSKTAKHCDDRHEALNIRMEDKVGQTHFRWMIGILIIIMISLFGTVGITIVTQYKVEHLLKLSVSSIEANTKRISIIEDVLKKVQLKGP